MRRTFWEEMPILLGKQRTFRNDGKHIDAAASLDSSRTRVCLQCACYHGSLGCHDKSTNQWGMYTQQRPSRLLRSYEESVLPGSDIMHGHHGGVLKDQDDDVRRTLYFVRYGSGSEMER